MTVYLNSLKMPANQKYIPFYKFIDQIYHRQNISQQILLSYFSKLYIFLNFLFVFAVWTRLNSAERPRVKKTASLPRAK